MAAGAPLGTPAWLCGCRGALDGRQPPRSPVLPGPAVQTRSGSHGARLEAHAVPVRHGSLVQEAPGASRGGWRDG